LRLLLPLPRFNFRLRAALLLRLGSGRLVRELPLHLAQLLPQARGHLVELRRGRTFVAEVELRGSLGAAELGSDVGGARLEVPPCRRANTTHKRALKPTFKNELLKKRSRSCDARVARPCSLEPQA
jgi:hypothetical protein